MSTYTTVEAISARVPPPHLAEALDDAGTGQINDELLMQIIADASMSVDAYLHGLYSLPLETVPPACQDAALAFACEAIYDRRGLRDTTNPWRDRAAKWREFLTLVARGEISLSGATGSAAWGSETNIRK